MRETKVGTSMRSRRPRVTWRHSKHDDRGVTLVELMVVMVMMALLAGVLGGSVILLTGAPGDPVVGFRHVKQPAEEAGPWQLLHDQDAGQMTVKHSFDLIALVKATGADGLTAKGAAAAIFQKREPSSAEVEKARRKLMKLETERLLVRLAGAKGGADGGTAVAWFLADWGH